MLAEIKQTILDECGLSPGSHLLVGVSGGADSISLLHALQALNIPVTAGHFNHLLREDAQEDAEYVEKFSVRLGIAYTGGVGDTPGYAEANRMTIEEAARELRYRFLFQEAERLGVDAVAVAHTADDQVETVMMHLIRGTGLEGLSGMRFRWFSPWHHHIPLVRPLLSVWKSQVELYCTENDLTPRFDRSNLDTTFFRNKIRHNVLPGLQELNPGFGKLVWQTAHILTQDQDLLQKSIQTIWENLVLETSSHHVAFAWDEFKDLHLAARRRILRKAIEVLRPSLRDIGFAVVEYGLGLIQNPPTSMKADLVADLFIQFEVGRIIIGEWGEKIVHPEFPQLYEEYAVNQMPGKLDLGNGWMFHAEELPARDVLLRQIFENQDPFTAYLDGMKVIMPLTLRIRRDGDRFKPLGMDGTDVNLADFMINSKIPVRARQHWPLVCTGDGIIWLPGYRIDHDLRVTENSKRILKLWVSQEE